MSERFNENLKIARKCRGISQREISEQIGVAKSTYSLYESGNREPNIQTIKKIVNVLNISADALLGLDKSLYPLATCSNGTKYMENRLQKIEHSPLLFKNAKNKFYYIDKKHDDIERAKTFHELMNSNGLKVADIARISNLPYSTVKYIMENGIEKTSYANVRKMCKALGITADELENMTMGNQEEPQTIAAHFDGTEYTEDELEEIKQFAAFVKNRKK